MFIIRIDEIMIANLFVLGVIAFFGLGLAVFVVFSAREWSALYYLSRNGELTDATIKNLFVENNKGTNGFISYQYYVGDAILDGKQQISRKHYKQFQERDYITIRFAPSKPSWSRLADDDFDNTYRNFSSYAAFAACLLFPPFIALWIATLIGTYVYLLFGLTGKKKKRSMT
jgi:hypothetical protein